MIKPGGKALVCMTTEIDIWVWQGTWDSPPGARAN